MSAFSGNSGGVDPSGEQMLKVAVKGAEAKNKLDKGASMFWQVRQSLEQ